MCHSRKTMAVGIRSTLPQPPSYPSFQVAHFSYLRSTTAEASRNKQLISFQLCTILSSLIKSGAIPLHPGWKVSTLCMLSACESTPAPAGLSDPVSRPINNPYLSWQLRCAQQEPSVLPVSEKMNILTLRKKY